MLVFFVLFSTFVSYASGIPESTVARLKSLYPDQTDTFVRERITVATTAQDKWTAFPPYFYHLVDRASKDSLSGRIGLCAGDAHLENFGFLLHNGSALFGLNDLDDSAMCSLDQDTMRLFIGHRLLTNFSDKDWLDAYHRGVHRTLIAMPKVVSSLKKDSEAAGEKLTKKLAKIYDGSCAGEFSPLGQVELDLLKANFPQFIKGCARLKIKGGSAGNRRFLVFYKIDQDIRAFELKPLVTPAPLYKTKLSEDERSALYRRSVSFFLGDTFKREYYPVKLGTVLYQRRPLSAGNMAIQYDDLASRDLEEVLFYEAYILGKYHSMSSTRDLGISTPRFVEIADKLMKKWKSEFGE